MAKKFTKWDIASHLKTEQEIAEYLEACFEEAGDDHLFIAKAIGDIARARGMSQVARKAKITKSTLDKAFSADGSPEFSIVLRTISALGLRLHVSIA